MLLFLLGLVPVAIWLVMLLARGGFWLARDRDDRDEAPDPASWPAVTAVVPARNEADVIARSVGSLLAQRYPGPFRVILVDDGSTDGTADAARAIPGAAERLEVLPGTPLPQGWTGKLWAVRQGVAHACDSGDEAPPEYLLLTDADIGHTPTNLRALVARAERDRCALVSLMAELSCANAAERFLIPAFVFFFQMLYPFRWVSDDRNPMAAAAGGCMLVRRTALEAAGGIDSIRHEIIDDCALGRRLKAQGPIRLSLTYRATSLRPYRSVAEIGRMVSRSAYAQLGYSPRLLAGTVLGMVVTYMLPVLLALFAGGWAQVLGFLAWGLMALAFHPMLRFYRISPPGAVLWGLALPAIGLAYTVFTLRSALDVRLGRGGMWKGRAQAQAGQGTHTGPHTGTGKARP
ncbi:glycosyltransferase [Roseomonas gilardii subsp. gilardii]|uniref:glycosyltransferase n=1 Tax=Roseomonas gilardii TaxID=257708 RepID=UPI001FFAD941|nr:glycosyltransferase [Roseomonas gilardii]UPG71365.1 glycosyltransferase [Roseomonas gilardii subsp. gilardii]